MFRSRRPFREITEPAQNKKIRVRLCKVMMETRGQSAANERKMWLLIIVVIVV